MSAIELRNARKALGSTPVLRGVELTVPARSITAVLGSSGAGKTTLLAVIAGLAPLDSGTLWIDGVVVDDGRRSLPAERRRVGYVPQEAALFPHLTVAANIAFGLRRRDRARVDELLELVALRDLRRRYPHQLSGGQQQRVALARALAVEPRVVLLDEPFAALDASLRGELRRDVARILRKTDSTAVLVTHDQEEALELSDQIAVLVDGEIRGVGDPRGLYRDPPDAATAAATGEVNLLAARLSDGCAICVLGEVSLTEPTGAGQTPGTVLLRPEQLRISTARGAGTPASVVEVGYHGHDGLARLRVAGEPAPLLARVPGVLALEPGQEVWIEVRGPGRALRGA